MNPTHVAKAPSLARSLLAATLVVTAFGLALGALWHNSEQSGARTASIPSAGAHAVDWR